MAIDVARWSVHEMELCEKARSGHEKACRCSRYSAILANASGSAACAFGAARFQVLSFY